MEGGGQKFVLESTDEAKLIGTFSIGPIGAWTSCHEDTEAGADYQVPTDKVFTITKIVCFGSGTGYLDMKYHTVANNSGGTRIGFFSNMLNGINSFDYLVNVPAGNYVNTQPNTANFKVYILGVEHDA